MSVELRSAEDGNRDAASVSAVCRFCATQLGEVVLDLGTAPLANSYLEPDQLHRPECYFPLCTYRCEACGLVQLPELRGAGADGAADAESIFGDYAYFSSYSSSWLQHAERYCAQQRERFALDAHSLVIEVASNDGYLLQYFERAGVPTLGIEPARNVAAVAQERGIPTLNRFLGARVASEVVDGTADTGRDSAFRASSFASTAAPRLGRQADLLVANNVFAHVPDLNDFTAGLHRLLAPTGVLTIEVQHLLRLLAENQFDTIYHEHFYYYSLHAAQKVLAAHGLVVFDVEQLDTHGGSLRLFCRRDDAPQNDPFVAAHLGTTPRVAELLALESDAGLDSSRGHRGFAQSVNQAKRALLRFLLAQADAGQRVVGYGAPAKGNTLLNYCGVRRDLLAYTVDLSPHKQGRYLPGTRIPIAAPEKILEERPDFVLILPWNLQREISEQMSAVRAWGGRFVVAVPQLTVLD